MLSEAGMVTANQRRLQLTANVGMSTLDNKKKRKRKRNEIKAFLFSLKER